MDNKRIRITRDPVLYIEPKGNGRWVVTNTSGKVVAEAFCEGMAKEAAIAEALRYFRAPQKEIEKLKMKEAQLAQLCD